MTASDAEMKAQAPASAWCDDVNLHVKLVDGREIITPLWWYPSLHRASHQQRNNLELMFSGIHWPDLDEDLSIAGMLRGWKSPEAHEPGLAAE
ncbi:MAG TPA: DUF2442 domain-containing protein [Devosia sp.]|jgi:hypothetical protein|uniref:DUF2442 domain-containing protein n=1 Tax=Devosia sp. TaxID=1871048 RepID=UPI002F94F226